MPERGPAGSRVGRLTAAATLLALAGHSLGCGRAHDDRVEVRFWAFGREGEVVQQLVPEFERRQRGIRVVVQQVPWTAAHEKLLTAFVADATPDLAQMGNSWIPEFGAIGALERLDAWLGRAGAAVPRDDYFPGIWDTNVLDGVLLGIPWYVDTRVLFYRVDLLAEVGVSRAPRTWDEWRDAMTRLHARMGAERYPVLLPVNEWAHPVVLAMQLGAPLLRDGDRFGNFREERFRRAFGFYTGLFADGLAAPVTHNQVANLYQQFSAGDFAMYSSGPWNVGEFRRRAPALAGRWATAPLPNPDAEASEPGVSLAGGSSLVILAASRRKAESWALVEFLSAPEQQVLFHRLCGDLPARRSAWEDPALAGDRDLQSFRRQLGSVRPPPKVPEWERIATRIAEVAESVVRGQRDVDEALAVLDHDVDRMLEKRRFLLERRGAAGGGR